MVCSQLGRRLDTADGFLCVCDCIHVTQAVMVFIRRVDRPQVSRFIVLYLVPLSCLLFLCFLYNYHQAMSLLDKRFHDFSVSGSDPTRNWSGIHKISLMPEDLKKAFVKSNGFLAATRKNRGKASGSLVCVVDPAITDCQNMGFAAFLLYTLDHILLCRALGINRPTVFWRACNSVCSRDPRVNSWEWYFEPVNHGLEWKVEHVICLLKVADAMTIEHLNENGQLNLRAILDNSFQKRTVEGFNTSKIITRQERLRVNKLIHQYVKPNSRIKEKVEMFYQQYLARFTVLGVHVRGTDHWKETSEKRLPPLMSWVKKAQSILETLPLPRKIFIASDNNEVIKKFVFYFGKETVSLFQFSFFFIYFHLLFNKL